MEYMLEVVLLHLPRTEKYSIGTEFKSIMYNTFENIMFIEKIIAKERLYYLNKIDAGLNVQRALLRIMKKHNWIDSWKVYNKTDEIMSNRIDEISSVFSIEKT